MKRLDLIGRRFCRLVVKATAETEVKSKKTCWNCVCDCGKETIVRTGSLESGNTKSCGCLMMERILEAVSTHGMAYTKEYRCWQSIRDRCYNKSFANYKHYGGRGIKVCDRWLESFENFYEDMGDKPSKKHSIDRINNDGNYHPDNCRWATDYEQAINKRGNKKTFGVSLRPSGNWQWVINFRGKHYSGTCATRDLAAKSYDDKNQEFGRGRPNKTIK